MNEKFSFISNYFLTSFLFLLGCEKIYKCEQILKFRNTFEKKMFHETSFQK